MLFSKQIAVVSIIYQGNSTVQTLQHIFHAKYLCEEEIDCLKLNFNAGGALVCTK